MFSDRARVRPARARARERRASSWCGTPACPARSSWTPFSVSATGGRVLRVEATPSSGSGCRSRRRASCSTSWTRSTIGDPRWTIARASDDWEVGSCARSAPPCRCPEDKREGRKNLVVDPASWWKALDFVGRARAAAGGRLLKLEDERRALLKERGSAARRRPGAQSGRVLRPRRRRRRDRRSRARRRGVGAGVLRARRALEARLRPALRFGARADPRRDRRAPSSRRRARTGPT